MAKVWRFVALVAVVGLLAAACGDSDDDTAGDGAASTAPTATATATTVAPVKGGTLTIGTFSEAPSLDPIVTTGASTTYGMEISAIYDRLVQYDAVGKKYVP